MMLSYTQTPGGPSFYRNQGGLAVGLYILAIGHAYILDVVNQDALNNSPYWVHDQSFFFGTILSWSYLFCLAGGMLSILSAYAGMTRYFIKVPLSYPVAALLLTATSLGGSLTLIWQWLSTRTIWFSPYIQLYGDLITIQLVLLLIIAFCLFSYTIKIPYKLMPPVLRRDFNLIDGLELDDYGTSKMPRQS